MRVIHHLYKGPDESPGWIRAACSKDGVWWDHVPWWSATMEEWRVECPECLQHLAAATTNEGPAK